jgi:hypothetical protein
MAVAVLFGEQKSAEQVNCVVSSVHQACPLYPQLLTYRCGAANRRFGPIAAIRTLAADVHCRFAPTAPDVFQVFGDGVFGNR